MSSSARVTATGALYFTATRSGSVFARMILAAAIFVRAHGRVELTQGHALEARDNHGHTADGTEGHPGARYDGRSGVSGRAEAWTGYS